jgi:hypothetical protein
MLLVFYFLALTGIYFSLLLSKQHDILGGRGKHGISYGCNGNIYWQKQEYVPPRERLHLSKDLLGSCPPGNSYFLLISPKYS